MRIDVDAASASTYPPIGDYALVGDSRAAGLVSRDGSIDWLCLPRFDSPSVFAALLDAERGGRFRVRPTGPFQVERRYLPNTNIIETTFHTSGGACILRDLFPVAGEAEKAAFLLPENELLREIEGVTGEVELELCYDPRPAYGRITPVLREHGALGIWCSIGSAVLLLRSELPLTIVPGAGATGRCVVRAGERHYLSLAYAADGPAVVPALGELARDKITRSATWWQDWAGRCSYDGPYRDAVVRSALALKLMTYAPSGAIVAAPTTSLPEVLGGDHNWDYRYCWLRDAALTLWALFELGYAEEAGAFFNWQLHATRLTQPRLQVLYDVFGRARLPELELRHLEGYAGSRPVRIGNGAHDQFQLDVYGEVVNAVTHWVARGGSLGRDRRRLLAGIGRIVCRRWREPDHGIWESRGPRRHHTYSKVMAWVALDRLLMLHAEHDLPIAVAEVRAEHAALRAAIESRGYNEQLGSYTQTFDGDTVDASLLTLPLYGYSDDHDPRMRGTFTRIIQQLGSAGLVHRYLPRDGEGAFGICSFWAVEVQARGGDVAGATERFERLLGYANDLGLFAEEIDPATGAALGNFPQAFTHVGLINAALTLQRCSAESGTAAWRG